MPKRQKDKLFIQWREKEKRVWGERANKTPSGNSVANGGRRKEGSSNSSSSSTYTESNVLKIDIIVWENAARQEMLNIVTCGAMTCTSNIFGAGLWEKSLGIVSHKFRHSTVHD